MYQTNLVYVSHFLANYIRQVPSVRHWSTLATFFVKYGKERVGWPLAMINKKYFRYCCKNERRFRSPTLIIAKDLFPAVKMSVQGYPFRLMHSFHYILLTATENEINQLTFVCADVLRHREQIYF